MRTRKKPQGHECAPGAEARGAYRGEKTGGGGVFLACLWWPQPAAKSDRTTTTKSFFNIAELLEELCAG